MKKILFLLCFFSYQFSFAQSVKETPQVKLIRAFFDEINEDKYTDKVAMKKFVAPSFYKMIYKKNPNIIADNWTQLNYQIIEQNGNAIKVYAWGKDSKVYKLNFNVVKEQGKYYILPIDKSWEYRCASDYTSMPNINASDLVNERNTNGWTPKPETSSPIVSNTKKEANKKAPIKEGNKLKRKDITKENNKHAYLNSVSGYVSTVKKEFKQSDILDKTATLSTTSGVLLPATSYSTKYASYVIIDNPKKINGKLIKPYLVDYNGRKNYLYQLGSTMQKTDGGEFAVYYCKSVPKITGRYKVCATGTQRARVLLFSQAKIKKEKSVPSRYNKNSGLSEIIRRQKK